MSNPQLYLRDHQIFAPDDWFSCGTRPTGLNSLFIKGTMNIGIMNFHEAYRHLPNYCYGVEEFCPAGQARLVLTFPHYCTRLH